jgi:hypothetical protein
LAAALPIGTAFAIGNTRRDYMMKRIFYLLGVVLLLAACRSSKDYLQRNDGDKALFDAVRKLNKKANDADAARALPILYTDAQKRHLDRVADLNGRQEPERWESIVAEYDVLQRMYEAIGNSAAASKLVRPADYQTDLYNARQSGAEAYYQLGSSLLALGTKHDARNAYHRFKQVGRFATDYKDTRKKLDDAYQSSILDVLINPVTDNSFVFNSGWGNTGYNYSNQYFQQNLVRDLGSTQASRYPARFYTEWEARRESVTPDWVVNLALRNLDIPRPVTNQSTRNVSRQIENGRDSTGKIIYTTVYATVTTYQQSFTAWADMDVEINEVATRKNITYNNYREQYIWQDAYATYTGDRRALGNEDLTLVGNRSFSSQPRREEVLNELYRKLYPQIRNRIVYAVDW